MQVGNDHPEPESWSNRPTTVRFFRSLLVAAICAANRKPLRPILKRSSSSALEFDSSSVTSAAANVSTGVNTSSETTPIHATPGTTAMDEAPSAPLRSCWSSLKPLVLEWCSQHKNDLAPTQDDDADSPPCSAKSRDFDLPCNFSLHGGHKTTDIEEWDQKFMQVDREMLFEIILAAKYMDIKSWRWLQGSREHDQGQSLHLRDSITKRAGNVHDFEHATVQGNAPGRDPQDDQHPERLQQGDGKPSKHKARGRANPVTNPTRRWIHTSARCRGLTASRLAKMDSNGSIGFRSGVEMKGSTGPRRMIHAVLTCEKQVVLQRTDPTKIDHYRA